MLSKQGLHIFVVIFCETAVVSMPRLANFSPCNPLIFCLSPLSMLTACWKTIFFRMFMGNYLERNRERKKFRGSRFQKWRKKVIFCTVLRSQPNIFSIFCWASLTNMQRKNNLTMDSKNEEPGGRNVRVWTVIPMFIFHEKCQSSRQVKIQNLPCNTQLFLVFSSHRELYWRLKKENLRFHGKWKVSLDTLR